MSNLVCEELVEAEKKYFLTLGNLNCKEGHTVTDLEAALKFNRQYTDSLLDLYINLTEPEERIELELEIDYLIAQAKGLENHLQLNNPEER